MNVALTAGGTGGHIFPALSVLEALRAGSEPPTVRFFGPENRGERAMVDGAGVAFEGVPAAAIRGRGPLALARSVATLLWGTLVATRKMRRFRPNVVFSTGGYASFPCSVAARLLRRPLVVYLPDVSPGWAVKAEARLATRLATTTVAALDHLPRAKTEVTGYPVRPAFFEQSQEEARRELGIEPSERVLLIAGGSQGAQAINRAVFAALPVLTEMATVVHVTGRTDIAEAEALASDRYRPAAFRDDLPTVMVAADLAVMRPGASTLGELTAAKLPAVLIPARYAGGHQRDNGRWLADAGAAVLLEEDDLDALGTTIAALLSDGAQLEAMSAAASSLARPSAAEAIAALIMEVARR